MAFIYTYAWPGHCKRCIYIVCIYWFINYIYVFEYLEWCLNYLLMTKRRQLIQKKNRHPSKNHTLLVFVISRVKQYNNYSYILLWKSGALDIEIRKIEASMHICYGTCKMILYKRKLDVRLREARNPGCLKCRFFYQKF